jgi:hypothetical protein
MAGPTSARFGAAGDFFRSAVVFMRLLVLAGCGPGQQKTHDRFRPWVLVKVCFTFDKHLRPRQLRRLPVLFVEYLPTLRAENKQFGCRCQV